MNLYGVAEDQRSISYEQFYIPTEVNGEEGVNSITGSKLDAFEAIYDFKPEEPIQDPDPLNLIKRLEDSAE